MLSLLKHLPPSLVGVNPSSSMIHLPFLADVVECHGQQTDYELSLPPPDGWLVREDNTAS